jgi:hypothetical protein
MSIGLIVVGVGAVLVVLAVIAVVVLLVAGKGRDER